MWILYCLGLGLVVSVSGQNDGPCSRKYLEGNDRKVNESQSNSDGCPDKEFRDLLNMVNNLNGDALNQTVVAEIASILSDLTSKSEGLSPGNLNASIMIINQLAVLLRDINITLNGTELESMMQAVSNVLQRNNTESWKKLNDVDKTIAANILSITDDFGLILATLNIGLPGHVTVSTDNLVLEVWSFERSNLPLQIEFPNGSHWSENREDRISISVEALNGSISSESQPTLNMWGVYYRTIHDYLPGKKDTHVINSRVLSFSIDGLKINDTLKQPVHITLRHNQEIWMKVQSDCAFWNFNTGDWDSAGCNVTSTNLTHTICSCDHLTNFAVLKSTTPWEDNEYIEYKLLPLIATVGCSISVAALIATIIVYALTWKAMFWNLSVAGPVLGLGWLVTSVLLISIGHVVLFYLFIIINSSQGSFIFIFHALLHNKTVKEKISAIYSNYICSCHKTFEEPLKKKDKSDLLPMVFRDNKEIEIQGSGLSSGTHTASIENSGTLETTH